MNVFLVWSGGRSHEVAIGLKKLLETCVQDPDYFISSQDIGSGELWRPVLARQLEETDFGIVCVTPENRNSRWLHFESGALAKDVAKARVVPYVYDLEPADVPPPLGDFQGLRANKEGTKQLVLDVSQALETVNEEVVEQIFERFWDDFEEQIADIPVPEGAEESQDPRGEDDKLNEVLQRVRRMDSGFSTHVAPDSRAIYVHYPTESGVVATYWYVVPTQLREHVQTDADTGDRRTVTLREPDFPEEGAGIPKSMVDYDEATALVAAFEPIPGLDALSREEVQEECEERGVSYSSALDRIRRRAEKHGG